MFWKILRSDRKRGLMTPTARTNPTSTTARTDSCEAMILRTPCNQLNAWSLRFATKDELVAVMPYSSPTPSFLASHVDGSYRSSWPSQSALDWLLHGNTQ